jgi:RNA polymerase sigma-70 factor (family 1)
MINKNDFKALFDDYYESIRLYIYFRIAEKDTADDMAQDVFMVVWEKRAYLNLLGLKSLLYRIASGLIVDYYRKCDVKADFSKWICINANGISEAADQDVEFNETMQRYSDALSKMPDGQRAVFLMNREENLTYREIAERLSLSVKAVEKRMSAALKILNENLLTL